MRIPTIVLYLIAIQPLSASEDVTSPWERHSFDVESGILWQVGESTNIDYELVQTQFSWRSPFVFKWDMGGGSTVVVRNHASLIAAWVQGGPEDYYLGISGSPSLTLQSAEASESPTARTSPVARGRRRA